MCQSSSSTPAPIQLLLFLDDRPSSQDYIGRVTHCLKQLKSQSNYDYELKIIEIAEQPHLVEYFRLIATPALVKLTPEPRQTLAGSNMVNQLEKWWLRWQLALEEQQNSPLEKDDTPNKKGIKTNPLGYSAELVKIADEVFQLKKEKEGLLEQLKFKDQVLAMLAHDLRSPLTAASIAVETLELTHHQDNTERIHQLRKQLYRQAKRQFQVMNRLITDILQASKSMNAQFQLHQTQIGLPALCEEILQQLKEQFQEKALVIEQDIPQDLPLVYADEELIRQVIINLLENAIKYTPESGTITLSILHRTSQKVQVSVEDTGPGIPEEKRERIFEGHFRLQRDEAKEGYGLGLSLCRKIIQAHYGQIWVDSTPDQGSSFHFTLPVYR